MPVAHATFDNATTKQLFSFYPDETEFDNEGAEFIGQDRSRLTNHAARTEPKTYEVTDSAR